MDVRGTRAVAARDRDAHISITFNHETSG